MDAPTTFVDVSQKPRVESTLPPEITAGELVRFSLFIRPGRPLAPGATLGLARNWPDDSGPAQWDNPAGANYIALSTTNGAGLAGRSCREASWHPFDHAILIDILDPLGPRDTVEIDFGAHHSPGFAAQTFIEDESVISVRLRETSQSEWEEIGRPITKVVGGAVARLLVIAPSIVGIGEPFALQVTAADRWGNPAKNADLVLAVDGGAEAHLSRDDAFASARLPVTLMEPGVHRLKVRSADGRFAAVSNPVLCTGEIDNRLYWGDIHAQSAIGCGAQRIETYFRFARDFAAVDFASHQANCFLISNDEWRESRDVTARFNEDGRFVALFGYEWSGATAKGGDRNIYFPEDAGELRRCSHAHVPDTSDISTDLPHVEDLHRYVRAKDVLMAVHVGGRTTNLNWHEPSTEKLLEVHSTHATSEWFLFEALRRGDRFGLTAGSDGVDGRPGASRPGRMAVRNLRGGLVATEMPTLDRSALWDALRAKRTYATTGERILLRFAADGHGIGEEYLADGTPRFDLAVYGTAPLRSVEIFRGTEPIFAAPIAPQDPTPSGDIRISWQGASAHGNWQRARMIWDGVLMVDNGRILDAVDDASDTPAEGITEKAEKRLAWTSITAGNWNSIVVSLAERPETVLRFAAGPMSTELALGELGSAPLEFTASDPERRLRIERLPREPAPPDWSGSFVDRHPPAGEHLYWLRVRQDDGTAAWSSPIFVRIEP